MNGNALIAFMVVEKNEEFGVGKSLWSVVSDSLAKYPEGPLP